MANQYGPWATSIDVGGNPQLSSFWRRRMIMLVPTSNASPRLAWRHLLWLGVAAALLFATPTLRSSTLATEEGSYADYGNNIGTSAPSSVREPDDEAAKQGRGTGSVKEWTLPNGKKMYITGIGGQRLDEIKKLVADKKYKFLSTFDSLNGETQYVYSFAFSNGSHTAMNFSMPLEKVASWDDYEKKRVEQQEQRQEKINQAITAGRFRLINVEAMQSHLCRDVKSGEKFKVQRIARPDGKSIAYPRLDYGKLTPSVTQTSWQEHLQAIREGKRELLDMETVNNYTYEMTADDGTRIIFNYGGGDPLTKPEAKKK